MANVQLTITVSEVTDVELYRFKFREEFIDVNRTTGVGTFSAPAGEADWLQWWMFGEPAGSIKVMVTRSDGSPVAQRLKSTIPNTKPAGYDRLRVLA